MYNVFYARIFRGTHKNYEKISIQLTAEEMELLVEYIYDYTIKLSKDNAIVSLSRKSTQGSSIIFIPYLHKSSLLKLFIIIFITLVLTSALITQIAS